LDEHVVVPHGMRFTGPTDYMLATTMEAVPGAIDCDSGESANAVRGAMVKIGLTAAMQPQVFAENRWQIERVLEDLDTKE
jgi:hypothetical protein